MSRWSEAATKLRDQDLGGSGAEEQAVSGKWFYSADGAHQTGPVAKEEIEQKLTRGELDASTLVWTETMAEWRCAADVAELTWERPATPPPLPATAPPPLPEKPDASPVSRAKLPRIEIHPRRRRNAMLLVGGALFFGLGGVMMVLEPEAETDQWWGAGLLVMSALCLFVATRLWRRRTSMVLAPERLEQITVYGAAAVPWTDVEKVGALSYLGQKLIGVRLRTYDDYLANVSPQMAGALTKMIPLLRVAASSVSMLPGSQLLTLWSRLDGVADPEEGLKSFGKVGDLAGWLMASRKMLGYDLTCSWADFDRPVDELVQLIEHYRSAAALAGSPPASPVARAHAARLQQDRRSGCSHRCEGR